MMPMPNGVHRFRVGDVVKFFGHGGEQVVRVSIPVDDTDEREFEVSASLIQPTRMAAG